MKTMQAVVLKEIGGLDKFVLQNTAVPQPRPGEALLRIKSTSLNRRDWWIAQGLYAKIKTPVILGSDVCGFVTNVGDTEDEIWVGKTVLVNPALDWGDSPKSQASHFRILGMPDNGGLAEMVCVPATQLFRKPEYLSEEEAGAIPLAGLTAFRALFTQGKATRTDKILITGIGGGVATFALQMALAISADTWITSGSEEKIKKAKKLGAADGILYHHTENLRKLSENAGGFDLIIDGTGGPGFPELISVLNPGGRMVSYGATAGNPGVLDLRKIFWKQITLQGSTMGSPNDFKAMLEFLENYNIKPVIDEIFPLADTHKAFMKMSENKHMGKLVIKP